MKAQGGYDNWQNTQYIQWNFFGQRTLLWDKYTGNVRVELSEDLQNTIIVNVQTGEGKAEKENGWYVVPGKLDKVSYWLIGFFVLTMVFLLTFQYMV